MAGYIHHMDDVLRNLLLRFCAIISGACMSRATVRRKMIRLRD